MISPHYPQQRPWTPEVAETLLDMSGGDATLSALGNQQLENAVALHRMLLDHGVAYLADEVGMGKTYVALAVIALFRHLQPGFRVLYLAPSANVREKWAKREYQAFLERNVRVTDLRVRSHGHKPAIPSRECATLDAWIASCLAPVPALDTFLSLSTLSFPLHGGEEDWKRRLRELAGQAGVRMPRVHGAGKKDRIKQAAAGLINEILPVYDLVVVDEAHLLKGGMNASDRVRFLARILGNLSDAGGERRFRGALLLSATPFDRDTAQLRRQLEIVNPTEARGRFLEEVHSLEQQPGDGKRWAKVHEVLRPFMVRRVQRLQIGTQPYSRNQYRVEHRSDPQAQITLKQSQDPEVLKQRLFTGLVQKLLIDCCTEKQGSFPPAMMASFEAYTLPSPPAAACSRPDNEEGDAAGDAMDTGEEAGPAGSSAFDAAMISSLVTEHIGLFKREPPHPKLEVVANRLSLQAFEEGRKQLVFVRRIKSVTDLKRRLEERFDSGFLAPYLEKSGVLPAAAWLDALSCAQNGVRPEAGIQSLDGGTAGLKSEHPIPASKENLFSWFFRGPLDQHAGSLVDQHGLPDPNDLRSTLTSQRSWESLLGELNWIGWVGQQTVLSPEIDLALVAERASALSGTDTRVSRYRRLQTAWLELAAVQLEGSIVGDALRAIAHYQRTAFFLKEETRDQISLDAARQLVGAATIPLGLYRHDLGQEMFPTWQATWKVLTDPESTEEIQQRALRRLDLHGELMFSLVRLDHPFIDLYIASRPAPVPGASRTREEVDGLLARFIAMVGAQSPRSFSTRRILYQLSEGWDYVVKTNFADLVRSSSKIERSRWRMEILWRIAPHSPVDWASGSNASSRSAIAKRFRMPGYPMVLVSTSVLQEGEDLHLFCDSVTHYGLSGSPIGIEQKNGRVDRIGALAHRTLQATSVLDEAAKIKVCFPHLTESLEWFQVRDLCHSLNEYLRSLHTFKVQDQQARALDETLGDLSPIPQLIGSHLESPFEALRFEEKANAVTPVEVRAVVDRVKDQRDSALQVMDSVAVRLHMLRDPGLVDHFRSGDGTLSLGLLPATGMGELLISAVRTVQAQELPARNAWDQLIAWGKDLCFRPTEGAEDTFRNRADCVALGSHLLQEEEVLDVLARLGVPEGTAAPQVPGRLTALLKEAAPALGCLGIARDTTRLADQTQHLYCSSTGNRRIDVKVVGGWLEMSLALFRVEELTAAEVFDFILRHNNNDYGIGYYLDAYYRIRARMVQPLAYLQREELLCMCRMLIGQVPRHRREL